MEINNNCTSKRKNLYRCNCILTCVLILSESNFCLVYKENIYFLLIINGRNKSFWMVL